MTENAAGGSSSADAASAQPVALSRWLSRRAYRAESEREGQTVAVRQARSARDLKRSSEVAGERLRRYARRAHASAREKREWEGRIALLGE